MLLADDSARVPVTESQPGTTLTKDEVLSFIGAPEMDKNGCQACDSNDKEFNWKKCHSILGAHIALGINILLSQLSIGKGKKLPL